MAFKGKTVLITGANRGIGLAMALKFAKAEANVVVFGKDTSSNLENVASQLNEAGGHALVVNVDVSDEKAIQESVKKAAVHFKGINILINNNSGQCFADTLNITSEQFDMLTSTSVRAAFFMAQSCFPFLKSSVNAHIVNISPPLNLDPHWFKNHLAFSIAKNAMSLCTLGMAAEFQTGGIAVNSLWPETAIATQTIKDHFSPKVYAGCRWPSIMADAVFELVSRDSRECTGRFFTDEGLLKETGVNNFTQYAVDSSVPLMQSLFLPVDRTRESITPNLFLQNPPK